ncbi:MAG: hypothetical protein CVU52_04650, partial [Deltaproteobacteria bacterium HGW-Deltaproteobacteria-10]
SNGNHRRTFLGSTEPLDAVYKPAFRVDSIYKSYFKPTMLTDQEGNLSGALQEDLLKTNIITKERGRASESAS